MSTPIYLKSSSVASKVPNTSALSLRELGVNTTDGILYLRQGTGVAGDIIIPVNPWKVSAGGTTVYNTYFTVGNVGIGTTNPTQSLHISGNTRLTGALYDGNNFSGLSGQVLTSTVSGTAWASLNPVGPIRSVTYQTASAGQTSFSVSYNAGSLDVFLNGSKLQTSDYTANDGLTVVLSTPAVAGDSLEFDSYSTITSNIYDVYSANTTTTSTSQISLINLSSTLYRSAEYTIQSTQGTNYKISKMLLVHDGTNVYMSEQNTIMIGTDMSVYDAIISGGNIQLLVTPSSASSTTFKVLVNAIKV